MAKVGDLHCTSGFLVPRILNHQSYQKTVASDSTYTPKTNVYEKLLVSVSWDQFAMSWIPPKCCNFQVICWGQNVCLRTSSHPSKNTERRSLATGYYSKPLYIYNYVIVLYSWEAPLNSSSIQSKRKCVFHDRKSKVTHFANCSLLILLAT